MKIAADILELLSRYFTLKTLCLSAFALFHRDNSIFGITEVIPTSGLCGQGFHRPPALEQAGAADSG